MAYIRRWVGKFFPALAVTVLLSACGSQEVKFDNSSINTPVLATTPTRESTVLNAALQQQDTFSLYEFIGSDEPQETKDQRSAKLIKFVASRFKKPEWFIEKIVETALKYSRPDFPTADDILAIIAVESTYNTNAQHRGSWGLMQIEAKSHRAKTRGESLKNIDTNIRVGTEVLSEYYEITHSRSGAIQAYNIGIGNFLAGKKAKTYLSKVNKEKAILKSI
jgi:hypothetical protein